MQPYAFGEEAEEDMYRTVTLEQLNTWLATPESERDDPRLRCIRVVLKAGEVLPEDVDCLQLTTKREGQEDEELDVSFAEFSMEKLFGEAFTEEGVDAGVAGEVLAKYRELTVVAE
jgi:hypothetical protein